jgi:protein-tyrosine phosphatase
MIDIHNHLLPGVDDGADSIVTSLTMIRVGVEEGIEEAVVTPHIGVDGLTPETDAAYRERFEELVQAVSREGLPIQLHLGSEIMFQLGLSDIRQLPIATYGGRGRYFLIEVPLATFPPFFEEALFRIRVPRLRPIFAHPERNTIIRKHPDIIDRLIEQGMLMQINATSLSGDPDRPITRLARRLIATGRAHFVATDAHGLFTRPFSLKPAYEIVRRTTNDETAKRLFIDHPRRAITGEEIEQTLPTEPLALEHRGLIGRLFRSF